MLLSDKDVEAISSASHVFYMKMMNNVAVKLDATYKGAPQGASVMA